MCWGGGRCPWARVHGRVSEHVAQSGYVLRRTLTQTIEHDREMRWKLHPCVAPVQGTIVCIDSTFSTPINSRALDFGADLVLHSATKYLAGHNDVLAGALLGKKELVNVVGVVLRERERAASPDSPPGNVDSTAM